MRHKRYANFKNRFQNVIDCLIDWLIDCCLTSSDKYFMHIKDENNSQTYTEMREDNLSNDFWLPLEKYYELGRDETLNICRGYTCSPHPLYHYGYALQILTWQPQQRGHPLFAFLGFAGQLCESSPGNLHQYPVESMNAPVQEHYRVDFTLIQCNSN